MSDEKIGNVQGDEHGKPGESVTKSVKKRRRPKKVNKQLSKEEIERKKKLANIVHKKVTTSCNWKNFIGQKLHVDNETGEKKIKEHKNLYKGTFRRSRKTLAVSKIKKDESVIELVDLDQSDISSARPRSPGTGPKPQSQSLKPTTTESTRSSNKSKFKPKPSATDSEPTETAKPKLTRFIGIDCEMVGVDDDYGKDDMLARVSLVNKFGECLYDKFVKPKEDIIDYRTHVSGVRAIDLKDAECFETVQKEVAEIIKGRVLVGHGLSNDLKVLYLSHPRRSIRDTSKYEKFRLLNKGRTPSLKKLAALILGVTIQEGEHNPVIDAKAAIQLYMMYQKEWEAELRTVGKGRWSKSSRKPRVQATK